MYLILNNFHHAAYAQPISLPPFVQPALVTSRPWAPRRKRVRHLRAAVSYMSSAVARPPAQNQRAYVRILSCSACWNRTECVKLSRWSEKLVCTFSVRAMFNLCCALPQTTAAEGRGSNPLMSQILRINVIKEEPQHFLFFHEFKMLSKSQV